MHARRLALLAALATACASAKTASSRPPVSQAPASVAEPAAPAAPGVSIGLLFVVEPRDAQIFLDGEERGTVAGLAGTGGVLTLAPGIYQVSLHAPGYVTWRAEVAVRAGREKIEVRLVRREPARR